MSNFREIMGGALNTSDLSVRPWESDVDRVAAMGKTSRLGSLLWRLKFANDPACYKPALYLLAKRLNTSRAILVKLCELAIREWCLPQCDVCQGAREIIVEDLRIVCKGCEGHGIKRYSDREREAFLGLPRGSWRGWAKKYGDVYSKLTDEERRVNVCLNIQLERIDIVEKLAYKEENRTTDLVPLHGPL
jgi:hypothetical protein